MVQPSQFIHSTERRTHDQASAHDRALVELYPEDLDHPFTRGDLSTLGIGWRQVAGPLWRRPYRGVHVWAATSSTDSLQRALDATGLITAGSALGTWAAACVGGAAELDGRGRSGTEWEPLVVCLPPQSRLRRDARIRPLRSPLTSDDIVVIRGVPVTVPVRTAFDIARTGTTEDGVVAIDYLGRGRPDFAGQVLTYAAERSRWKGVPQVRRAARLASWRSRSAGETRMRLLWRLDARLGDPEVNASVFDRDGHLLGMTDLLDPARGLVGEYDGAAHRDVQHHANDNAREEWLENAGLIVVRAGSPDMSTHRKRTVARMEAAANRAALRERDRASWSWAPGPPPTPSPHW